MKTIKKISICLLSLLLLAIVPISNVSADENDNYPIMTTGQTIPKREMYGTSYTTYRDDVSGYQVQFKIILSYERCQNGTKIYVKNVEVYSCTAGVDDNIGPQDGSHYADAISASYRIDDSGSKPYAVVTATVSEYVKGLGTTNRSFTYRFEL